MIIIIIIYIVYYYYYHNNNTFLETHNTIKNSLDEYEE